MNLYEEIEAYIQVQQVRIYSISTNLLNNEGDWHIALQYVETTKKLEGFVKRIKLFQREEIDSILRRLVDIRNGINGLNSAILPNESGSAIGYSRIGWSVSTYLLGTQSETSNMRTQKQIDAGSALSDLEGLMRHILSLIDERRN